MWGDVGDDGLRFHQQQRLGLTRRRAVPPRSPFLPCLGSGQCPVTPESPLQAGGSVQAPLPPAHFLLTSSHPTQRQRPDQTSPSHQTITLGLPSQGLCCSQTHLVPGTWLLSLPNPEMAQGDSCPLLSVCWGATGPTSSGSHTAPVPSPPTCSSLLGSLPHFVSLHRDSRHIE